MNNIYYILYIYPKLKYFFLNIDLLIYYIAWYLTITIIMLMSY